MQVKNIVFDMGNVLVWDDMPAFCAAYVPEVQDQTLVLHELFYSIEWVKWDRGTLNTKEVAVQVCNRLPERLHEPVRAILSGWHNPPAPNPTIESLIYRLKQAGYGIFLLSNTAETYHDYRHYLPGIELFDGEFISADYRLLKPDHRIYEAFVQKFSLNAEECFFVDDNHGNVEGAIDTGWKGFVFRGDTAALETALRKEGVRI